MVEAIRLRTSPSELPRPYAIQPRTSSNCVNQPSLFSIYKKSFNMIISTRPELAAWLEKNYWFEDGYILSISQEGGEMSIRIGFQSNGNYIAGTPKELTEFELRLINISECTYQADPKIIFGYDCTTEGVDPMEETLGLKFDSPTLFKVAFQSIEISTPTKIQSFTKPHTSDNEFSIEIQHSEIPTPDYWLEKFEEQGLKVCFRYFGSEEISLDKVPYPDYSGYFLQFPHLLKDSNGLFFRIVGPKHLVISTNYSDNMQTTQLFDTIKRITASWSSPNVRTGNVQFEGDEWRNFVEHDNLPARVIVPNDGY